MSAETHAVSVHAYYPPLPLMRRYSRTGPVLRLEAVEQPEDWHERDRRSCWRTASGRELGHRVGPREAARASRRPAGCWWTSATRSCGSATALIPGALIVERNELEWRLDPTGQPPRPGGDAATTCGSWWSATRATHRASRRSPCASWGCTGPPIWSAVSRPGGRRGCRWWGAEVARVEACLATPRPSPRHTPDCRPGPAAVQPAGVRATGHAGDGRGPVRVSGRHPCRAASAARRLVAPAGRSVP